MKTSISCNPWSTLWPPRMPGELPGRKLANEPIYIMLRLQSFADCVKMLLLFLLLLNSFHRRLKTHLTY